MLSLDLNLIGLELKEDTVIIFLDFFVKNQEGKLVPTTTIEKGYVDCYDMVALVFVQELKKPVFAVIGEAIIDYRNIEFTKKRDENFRKCINGRIKLNKWLKNYMDDNNL